MKFNNKSLLAHIKSALIWAGTGYVLAALATFAHIALLSRNLPLNEFGVYILLYSFAILFSTLAGLGLPEALVKVVAKYQRTDTSIAADSIRTAVLASFLSATLLSAVLTITGKTLLFPFFEIDWNPTHLTLLCGWFFLLTIQAIFAAIFKANHDIKKSTFFGNTLRNSLYFFLTYFATSLHENFSLDTALSVVVVATLLNNIISLIFLYRLPMASLLRRNIKASRKYENIFSVSFPLLGNLITQLIFARIGIWALGYYSTKDTIAIYGAAVQLSTLISMTLLIINSMALPLIADLYHNNKKELLQRILRSITTLVALPIIILYFLVVLFGQQLLSFIFGDAYSDGYLILLMLATGQLGNLLAGPCGLILKMTGNHKLLLKINYLFVAVMAPLTVFFASQLGAHGVALIAMLSFILQNLVSLYFANKLTGINSAIFLSASEIKNFWLDGFKRIKNRNM
jgi:O-antigen/teichoic acid export membrane protein